MMRKRSSRAVFIWLATAVGLIALLILPGLLSPQARQTAHAQPAPREILVNAECNTMANHEHIRFGLESSHYYNFWAKAGKTYKISTTIYNTNTDGLTVDTRLILYRHSPLDHPGQPILAENDDVITPGSDTHSIYRSEIDYLVYEDGYYWIEVQNMRVGGEGSYCLEVALSINSTRFDVCEPNDSFEQACEIALQALIPNKTLPDNGTIPPSPIGTLFNFAPLYGAGPDQDYYKLWVKAGERYKCEITDMSALNDTVMTLYDHHRTPLAHNEDREIGDRQSQVQNVITWYTGWLYIHVRPVVEVNYDYAHLYTYKLQCARDTAPIDNYNPPRPLNPGQATVIPGGASLPDAEEVVAAAEETPAAPAPSVGPVSFVALPQPAATPQPVAAGQAISFTVQIYHDKNDNQIKDPDEGIVNLPVYIYGGAAPLQTVTGMGGGLFVGLEMNQNTVRLVIPYLGVNQEIPVANAQDIRIRIAP